MDLPVRLVASDIDDAILGDTKAAEEFRATWESLDSACRPLLVYNSGRSVADVQWLVVERRIPSPELIIGGIGTEVHDPLDARIAEDFRASLTPGWNAEIVKRIAGENAAARLQPAEFLNPHKLSWHWHRATAAELFRLEYRLRDAGLEVIIEYGNNVFLDVIPRRAGKGNALTWLCQRVGVSLENVIVAGAGPNNRSMFALPGVRGIIPSNASRELFIKTTAFRPLITRSAAAAGVLEGLRHFGVLDPADRDTPSLSNSFASS